MESFLTTVVDSWIYAIECLFDAIFTLGKTEILVLFSIVFLGQKKYRVLKNLSIYFWGMFIFLLLPFVAIFINEFTNDFEGYYTGFCNLLPTNFLIAATITYILFSIRTEDKRKLYIDRCVLGLVAFGVIFLLGRSNYYLPEGQSEYDNNMSYLQFVSSEGTDMQMSSLLNVKVQNRQKVLDEVVSVVNIIRADAETPMIAVPFEYSIYIRQYAPECKLAFGRYDSFWTEEIKSAYAEGNIDVIEPLLSECTRRDVEYIVFPLATENIYYEVTTLFGQNGWNIYAVDANRIILKKCDMEQIW